MVASPSPSHRRKGFSDAPAGLLARGSKPVLAPSRFPSGRVRGGSPLTVAGAAADRGRSPRHRIPVSSPPTNGWRTGASGTLCAPRRTGKRIRRRNRQAVVDRGRRFRPTHQPLIATTARRLKRRTAGKSLARTRGPPGSSRSRAPEGSREGRRTRARPHAYPRPPVFRKVERVTADPHLGQGSFPLTPIAQLRACTGEPPQDGGGRRKRQDRHFFRCRRLCKRARPLLYGLRYAAVHPLFPGSSVVEQPAVNRLVAGSKSGPGSQYDEMERPPRGLSAKFRPVATNVRRRCLASVPNPAAGLNFLRFWCGRAILCQLKHEFASLCCGLGGDGIVAGPWTTRSCAVAGIGT